MGPGAGHACLFCLTPRRPGPLRTTCEGHFNRFSNKPIHDLDIRRKTRVASGLDKERSRTWSGQDYQARS